jgi:tetratricopeptide (TPR) repeat protein
MVRNKLFFVFVFMMVLLLTSLIFASKDELAELYYQEGSSLFEQNKFYEAVEKINKALSYREVFPQALCKLAECYDKLRDNTKAVENYMQCIKQLQNPQRPAEEERLLSYVMLRLEVQCGLYYQSGLGLLKQNKPKEALEKFNIALLYQNNYIPAHFGAAECYEKLQENKKALRIYRECVNSLNSIISRSKKEEETLSSALKAIERLDFLGRQLQQLKNIYTTGLLTLANDCMSKKHHRFVRKIVQAILGIDPKNTSARELLSRLNRIDKQ